MEESKILSCAWMWSEGSGDNYVFSKEALLGFAKELLSLSQQDEPAPAQTEQQPVGQVHAIGPFTGDYFEANAKLFKRLAPGTRLYAGPIAQTAPQPEQSGLAERLKFVVADLKAGFVACRNCGNQEDTSTLDCVPELQSIAAALSAQGK